MPKCPECELEAVKSYVECDSIINAVYYVCPMEHNWKVLKQEG